jgi:hypothetical protein
MYPTIDNPMSCEFRAVNIFVHAENVSDSEIHCQLCSRRTKVLLKQWRRIFKDCRKNGHVEKRSVLGDILVQNVHQRMSISSLFSRDFHSKARLSQALRDGFQNAQGFA